MDQIPLAECQDGGLYRIFSRNLRFGVFVQEQQGFIGIRCKFDSYYLFTEYHWETGAPFGTVNPKQFLEMCPISPFNEGKWEGQDFQENKALFDWLKERQDFYLGIEE